MRQALSKRTQMLIYQRDGWCCRYCGTEVFLSPALKALESVSPGFGYYHRNGHSEKMTRLFFEKCASVDHINPVVLGGTNDVVNLVTACWLCNLTKNSNPPAPWIEKMEAARPKTSANWDGFVSILAKLQPDSPWLKYLIEDDAKR